MSSFMQTQPHLAATAIGQSTIRTGPVVPEGAINLAYFVNKKLHPNDNVSISDALKLNVENLAQVSNREMIMTPDLTTSKLLDLYGNSSLKTEFIEITNKFVGDVPLYYSCKLKSLFYDKNASDGQYVGQNILIEKESGAPLYGDDYKYKVYLEKYGTIPGVFSVIIYTSFTVDNVNKVIAKYNAIEVSGQIIVETKPHWREKINPIPFMKAGEHFQYKGVVSTVKSNEIVVTRFMSTKDTRDKKTFKFKIKTASGKETAWVNAYAVSKSIALPHEESSFFGESMLISPLVNGKHPNGIQMISAATGIDEALLVEEVFSIAIQASAALKSTLSVTIDPSGESAPVALVLKSNDIPLKVAEKYAVLGDRFVECFSVKMKDHRVMSLQRPLESDVFENWYPRISSGYFEQNKKDSLEQDVTAVYMINEYHRQPYSFKYGKPFVEIIDEKVEILDSHNVKLRYSNLFVELSNLGIPNNLRVVRISNNTTTELHIAGWNSNKCLVEIVETLSKSDIIKVDYVYEEDCLTYRGCNVDDIFLRIDLNPNKYHTYDKVDYTATGRILNVELDNVFNLFNLPIVFFMRPYKVIKDGTVIQTNEQVIYHKFDETPLDPLDILVGKTYLKHNTTFSNLKLIDTRVRGGGLLEVISEDIRKELEPESDFYYDIGFWDGEPYSENSVIIVRLDSRVLIENGGKFSKEDVQKVVNKWVAYGTLVIVEYMNTFSESNSPSNTIRVNKFHSNRLDFLPAMSAFAIGDVENPSVSANQIDTLKVPYGIIRSVEIEKPKEFIVKALKQHRHPNGFTSVATIRVVDVPVVITQEIEYN